MCSNEELKSAIDALTERQDKQDEKLEEVSTDVKKILEVLHMSRGARVAVVAIAKGEPEHQRQASAARRRQRRRRRPPLYDVEDLNGLIGGPRLDHWHRHRRLGRHQVHGPRLMEGGGAIRARGKAAWNGRDWRGRHGVTSPFVAYPRRTVPSCVDLLRGCLPAGSR
jgi:hypothetical protein